MDQNDGEDNETEENVDVSSTIQDLQQSIQDMLSVPLNGSNTLRNIELSSNPLPLDTSTFMQRYNTALTGLLNPSNGGLPIGTLENSMGTSFGNSLSTTLLNYPLAPNIFNRPNITSPSFQRVLQDMKNDHKCDDECYERSSEIFGNVREGLLKCIKTSKGTTCYGSGLERYVENYLKDNCFNTDFMLDVRTMIFCYIQKQDSADLILFKIMSNYLDRCLDNTDEEGMMNIFQAIIDKSSVFKFTNIVTYLCKYLYRLECHTDCRLMSTKIINSGQYDDYKRCFENIIDNLMLVHQRVNMDMTLDFITKFMNGFPLKASDINIKGKMIEKEDRFLCSIPMCDDSEDYSKGEISKYYELPCGHNLCTDCTKGYFKQSYSSIMREERKVWIFKCPMCRMMYEVPDRLAYETLKIKNWTCSVCTLENPNYISNCQVCGTTKKGERDWNCLTCTFVNPAHSTHCSICASENIVQQEI
jgi:hypothetical protein